MNAITLLQLTDLWEAEVWKSGRRWKIQDASGWALKQCCEPADQPSKAVTSVLSILAGGVLSISKAPSSRFGHFYSWCRKGGLLQFLRPTGGTGDTVHFSMFLDRQLWWTFWLWIKGKTRPGLCLFCRGRFTSAGMTFQEEDGSSQHQMVHVQPAGVIKGRSCSSPGQTRSCDATS